jgi:hypothetical protein
MIDSAIDPLNLLHDHILKLGVGLVTALTTNSPGGIHTIANGGKSIVQGVHKLVHIASDL